MTFATGRRVAVTIAMCIALALPASAQDGADLQTFGDWQILCDPVGEEGEQCALSQYVVAEDREEVRLNAFFFYPPEDSETLLLSILVPLNVILTRRLGMQIDDEARQQFDFIRCSDAGCLVSIEVDDSLRTAFQNGNEALFLFFFEDTEGVGLPVSLNGITAGLEALPRP